MPEIATVAGARPPLARAAGPGGRLRGLDALRGIAALVVTLHHLGKEVGSLAAPPFPLRLVLLHRGYLGVDLFFIISGFVILRTLERTRGLGDFAVSRFARLYPAYVACSLLTVGLIAFSGYNPNGLTVRDALLNGFMISDLLGVKEISYSYWTLQYEVLFYAAAACVYLGLRIRRVEIPCLAWLAVMAVGQALGWDHTHARLSMLLEIRAANLFVIGMMLHRLDRFPASRVAALTLACGLALSFMPREDAPVSLVVPATFVFTGAVWLAARDRLGFLCTAPMLFLGDISYSLYLVHQMFGEWLVRRLYAAGWSPYLGELAALALVVVLAILVRYSVELPGQRAIKHLWRRLGGKVHATEPAAVA